MAGRKDEPLLKPPLQPSLGIDPKGDQGPTKSEDGVTYDFEAIREFIRRSPNSLPPHAQTIRRIEEFKFDFAHINTILERLNKVKSKSILKQDAIMRNNLLLINMRGNASIMYIQVLHILADRGELSLGDAFQGSPRLKFLDLIKQKCSVDYIEGKRNRLEQFDQLMANLEVAALSTVVERHNMMAEYEELSNTAGVIKKIWRKTLPHQNNSFVAWCRWAFKVEPHEYLITVERDPEVSPFRRVGGWARAVDIDPDLNHAEGNPIDPETMPHNIVMRNAGIVLS